MQLILENVRCFTGRHEIPIRPLTLLVGENSAGKSTLLAILSAISQRRQFPFRTAFNAPPYDLGNYTTIASHQGRTGSVKSFTIGYRKNAADFGMVEVLATFAGRSGQPSLSAWSTTLPNLGAFTVTVEDEVVVSKLEILTSKGPTEQSVRRELSPERIIGNEMLVLEVIAELLKRRKEIGTEVIRRAEFLAAIVGHQAYVPITRSLAPVRTKPRRTYDEITDEFRPEGDHIPLILSRLFARTNGGTAGEVFDAVNEFGAEAGLFNHIDVRRLGDQPADPFQVQVTVANRPVNLPDVGYGVSQALPVVVEGVLTGDGQRLLVQQPEVHLHPRAQAALGTFLAKLVATQKREFVVETHSDHLVDRVRQEVASGRLKKEQVLILFFDRQAKGVRVAPIELDENGNVLDPPPTYRKFFIDEELRLLTRTSR